MKVDSFIFYTSWLEAIEELSEDDQFITIKAILRYQAYHENPNIKGAPVAIFKMAKPIIDELYSRRMASIENGRKGGRPKSAQSEETEDKADGNLKPNKNLEKPSHNLEKPRHNLEKPSPNLNVNVNDNVNVNVNANANDNRKSFTPPSIEDVKNYCLERNNGVDYQRFYDYYSAAGWKDKNGNPVKNWKQKMIINWEDKVVKSKEDKLPTYDSTKNNILSKAEEDELLKLLGKA